MAKKMMPHNKLVTKLLRLFLFSFGLAFALTGSAADRYVATNGNDSTGNGTLANPYNTIQKGFNVSSAGDTVHVRGGTYRETVTLTGKSGSTGNPITLTAYSNEVPVISGLDVKTLTWSASGTPNVYVASYSSPTVKQLFFNGKPMVEARWPNVPLDASGDLNFFTESQWAAVNTSGNTNGTIKDADLAATGWNVTGARVVLNLNHQYYCWTRTVLSHSAGSNTFTYATITGDGITAALADFQDDLYYLSGQLTFLDVPGEWYHDTASSLLYFYAPNGVDPATGTVEVKVRDYGINANSTSQYLTVDGITFFGTAFKFGSSVDSKSANIIFRNNTVLYSSWTEYFKMPAGDPNKDLDLVMPTIYADNSQVVNSTFAHGALCGLFISGFNNLLENNVFHDFNYNSTLANPPLLVNRSWAYWNGKAGRATVRFNTVYNSGGIAINPGQPTNEVYLNYMHDMFRSCWGGNKDVSALYTGGTNAVGSRYHHNWISDGSAGAYPADYNGGLGIRGDDDTAGLTVDHNVTWNLGSAGIVIKNVANPTTAQANQCVNNTVFNEGTNNAFKHSIIIRTELVKENTNSSCVNNMAEKIYGGWDRTALGTIAQYTNNSINIVSSNRLENIRWFDFRPLASAANIIDQGITNAYATNFVGSAPDIGAYERGDSIYFIPGQRSSKATFPIVPDAAVVSTNRDVLMWRPAYSAASHRVYFGTSSNAVQVATTNSVEYQGSFNGETNVFFLPALSAGQNYYWRIDAVMTNSSVVTGDIWAFITVANSATWDGGSLVDANWTTATNWNSDGAPSTNGTQILTFAGTTRTTNTNNFATDTAFAGINFSNTVAGQSFTLNGNRITLGGNIVLAAAAGTINDSCSIPMILSGDRTITANTSHNLTVSGIISDDGGARSLVKDGAATLTLSATNSFTGALTISNGTVSVNSLAGSGTPCAIGAGSVITIGGTATLTYTGGGATINRTFNKGTQGLDIAASGTGALIISGDFNSTSGTLNLKGGSASTITNEFQSYLGGTGALLNNGGNIWKLSNNTNDFTGQIQLSSATLLITTISNYGTACAIGKGTFGVPLRIGNLNQADGVLNYLGSGASCNRQIQIGNGNGLGGARILNNGSGALIFTTNAFNQAAGANTTTGSRTLTLGGNNPAANEIQGKIQDNTASAGSVVNLTKIDSGTWILSGTNTYTGATLLSNGMLRVNGSLAAASTVTVSTSATLGGTGTVNGPVTLDAGAIIAPGAAALGTLTLSNNLTLDSGAVAFFRLNTTNSPATNDYLVVVGAQSIMGSTLIVTNLGPALQAGNTFKLLGKTNSAAGFTTVDLPPGYTWTNKLVVDGTIQVLAVTPAISSNASLSSLVLGPTNTLSPTFVPNILAYTASQPYISTNITVTPTAADTNATIRVIYAGSTNTVVSGSPTAPLTLDPNPLGANVVTVRVVAQDAVTMRDYVVDITRQPSQNVPTFSASFTGGTNLTLSWPLANSGYTLQSQTNSLTGTWYDVAGSTTTNQMSFHITPADSTEFSMFYRLKYLF